VRQVTVAPALAGPANARALLVVVDAPRPVPAADVTRLKRWLGVRLPDTAVEVFVGKAAP
jgi:hypothetical protein